MRIFRSEFSHSYKTYSFGYTNYAEMEKGDDPNDLYSKGFLPYSGSKNINTLFYLARSCRVNLEEFTLSSENRRISKKFDGHFTRSIFPARKFTPDNAYIQLCLKYFQKLHGPRVMPKARLLQVLAAPFVSEIFEYKSKQGQKVAYVVQVSGQKFGHYWFSFYDTAFVRQSFGVWLMQDAICLAKSQGKKYYYLGTVYGEKALYKTNFMPLEYWNGNDWINDIRKLKSRSRSDQTRVFDHLDEWKESHELF